MTVECLAAVQLEGESSEFGGLAVMTPDLFLLVACRLSRFAALLKGFLFLSINFIAVFFFFLNSLRSCAVFSLTSCLLVGTVRTPARTSGADVCSANAC